MQVTYDKPIKFEWCIGFFKGEAASRVMGLANEGVGYFIRRSDGRGQSFEVEAAFRRVKDSPRPAHLQLANPSMAQKLDKMYAERHGQKVTKVSIPKPIANTFFPGAKKENKV